MSIKKDQERVTHASLGVHNTNPGTPRFIYLLSIYLVVLGIEPKTSSKLGVVLKIECQLEGI